MSRVFVVSLTLVLLNLGIASAGVDLEKLKNDKEVVISAFGSRARTEILRKFPEEATRDNIIDTFQSTLKRFLSKGGRQCELRLIEEMQKSFSMAELPADEESLEDYFKLARILNHVDDIFYEILSADNRDYFALAKLRLISKPGGAGTRHHKLFEKNNLEELYSNFEPFPDEINQCAYQEFIFLRSSIVDEKGDKAENPLKLMGLLNKKAFQDRLISLPTYHKLEYLRRKSELKNRYIFLRDYLTIVNSAKNQMVPVNRVYTPFTLNDEDKFSSERMKRFSRLTRRKLLYRKYDETQIILLAQILQKASRRMGVDVDTQSGVPYLTQEFRVTDRNGEQRTYVEKIELDPQSQFNLARRLMRKDILETQMMDSFNKIEITYQDIVMAAFETGYITIEDIAYVVRYDDLWNPATSKFERITGFVFKVSGYATFFLPTPWNVVGTIALGVIEGMVDNKNSSGADNDNPATFIE